MKRAALLALLGALLVAPAWLAATEAGLHCTLAAASRLTHGALRVGEAHGRLLGEVTLRDFAYETAAVTVTIERAVVELRLSRLLSGAVVARALDVQGLRVATHPAEAAAAPSAPLTVSLPLALAVEDGHLADFRLSLRGQERWSLPDARFAARWSGRWIAIGRLEAQTVEAGAVGVRGRIAIADGQLQLDDVTVATTGELHAQGAVALGEDADSDLAVSWKDLRSPRPDLLPWLDTPQGSANLKGPWRDYAWTARGHVRAAELAADVDGHGRGTLRALSLEQVDVAALDGRARASGRVAWSPALSTDLALRFEGVNPGVQYKEWPGRLAGEARLAAQWGDGATRMEFDGTLHDSQLRGYPLALAATGRTEGGDVFLRQLELQSGGTHLQARGQLLPRMDLAGEARSDDLRSLWAGLAGRGAARVHAVGTFGAPQVELHGALDDFAFAGYRARHVALDGTVAPQGRNDLQARLTDVRAGVALKTLSLDFTGTRAAHRLRADASAEDGEARIALEGALAGNAWRGRLTDARIAPAQGAPWVLEDAAGLTLARGRFATEPVCFGNGDSRACARVESANGQFLLAFRTRDFDFAHLKPWLPPDLTVTGTLSGTALARLVRGELVEVRADLAGSAGSVQSGDAKLAYGPGTLRVQPDGEKLHAELHLTPAGGVVDGEVWVAPAGPLLDRPMLGDLTLRLPDLSWLPVLSPEIASAKGALDAHLHVSGSPRSPVLDGKLNLADGRIGLATPGIELTDLTASFERGLDAPLSLHVEGTSGKGRLVVDGQVRALQPKVAGEITIKGANVLGVNTTEVRAWLSPDLKLTLGEGTARLTGQLGVPRAEITPRELRGGGVAPSGDQVVVREEEAAPRATLRIESEVKIVLGDDVKFDGLGLKTQLTGAITAIDDPERPTRGRGELALKGGRYKAYGQELKLEEGRLIFTGGPITDPAIDITASRQPREDIKVSLHARGTLEKPEFTLTSDPPGLTQEEQLSWLVLGRSLSSTMDSSQRTQLSGAALSLGLSGGDYLAQQLAPRLGVDQVSIAAKPGDTADLARFTIGKYLSPRLFVSYGVGLFQPGHFFRLQYDLGKHFKLVGESGVVQGGELDYTIER